MANEDQKSDSKKADDVPQTSGDGSVLPIIVIAAVMIGVIVLALVFDKR